MPKARTVCWSKIIFSILILSVVSNGIFAQIITLPVAESTNQIIMPAFGSEALIPVQFTVNSDGTTDDLVFGDGFSNSFVEKIVRDNVKNWRFTPASVDGVAVDLYNQQSLVIFRFDPDAPPPAPPGRRGKTPTLPENYVPRTQEELAQLPATLSVDLKKIYDQISQLINKGNFSEADKAATKALRSDVRTLFDFALINQLLATTKLAQKDPFNALLVSKLATTIFTTPNGNRFSLLSQEALITALYQQTLIALMLHEDQLAIQNYNDLINTTNLAEDDQLHVQVAEAQARLDSPDPLYRHGKIINKNWKFSPSRSIFTLTNVNGKIKGLTAHCFRRNLKLEYQENVEWTLPPGLGDCLIEIEGNNDTSFIIYEFSE